jgi:putative membrane protein
LTLHRSKPEKRKVLDLLLAITHHLAVFALVALLAAEFALLRPGIEGQRLAQLGAIDRAYGAVAGLVIVAGLLRVFFGAAGWSYYAANWVFWAKIGAFLLVGLLSIGPTVSILRWRRSAGINPAFAPAAAEVSSQQKFLYAQVAVLAFIPAFAAAMARGYGL